MVKRFTSSSERRGILGVALELGRVENLGIQTAAGGLCHRRAGLRPRLSQSLLRLKSKLLDPPGSYSLLLSTESFGTRS